MIRRRFLLPLVPALALAHCGPSPKPPAVLTLTLVGSAAQNPDTSGKASPVAVRIYQLTQTAKFERADVFALTEREAATLGQDSAGSQEFVLSLLWLAVVLSIGSIAVLYWLIKRQGATQVASLFYLVPAVTALGGVGLLGEPLTIRLVIATTAMLAGIALVLTQQARLRP